MATLRARDLSLEDVHQFLEMEPIWEAEFEDFLSLEPVSPEEKSRLEQVRSNFKRYLLAGQVSEGQVRIVALNPLLQIAGYDQSPFEYRSEENIAQILIEDQDLYIRGRFDLLVINRQLRNTQQQPLWILVVESKNLCAAESTGIPQLLTYAHSSLQHQSAVWGMVTNGEIYRLFYIEKGTPTRYYHMPSLSLMRSQQLIQLLKALKAIRATSLTE